MKIRMSDTIIDTSGIAREFRKRMASLTPKASHGISVRTEARVSGRWRGDDHNEIDIIAIRDGSKITMNLNFGNMWINQQNVEESAQHAFKHLEEAVNDMMAARRELEIHAATLGFLIMTKMGTRKETWENLENALYVPLSRRTNITITPKSIFTKGEGSPEKWTVGRNDRHEGTKFRLPAKRILSDSLVFDTKTRISGHRDRVWIRGTRLTEAIGIASTGKCLSEVIPLPEIACIGARIESIDNREDGLLIGIKSPSLSIEQAYELAAEMINLRPVR